MTASIKATRTQSTISVPVWRDRILGLERLPAHRLMDHAAKWRLHPAWQREALAGVLEEIGQAAALLVYHSARQGGLCILDGHLRKSMAPDATWPCLLLDVTDDEADLLLATLDPLAAMAERDERALAALLGGLHTDQAAVAAMLSGLADGDRVGTPTGAGGDTPAAPAQGEEELARLHSRWQTRSGQVWGCGVHRVLCGDATAAESYVKILAGGEVDAVVTDPPYGVGMPYGAFADTLENVRELVPKFWRHLEKYGVIALTPGIPALWWYPRPTWLLCWVHPAPTGSGPWGFNGFNPVLVYGKDPYLREGLGRRLDHIVLSADREWEDVHPTTKPFKVWSWLVERVTPHPGQTVLDPFLGSGTTLIAAEQLGRRCLGIEIDPKYVALTLERWERTTGETPTLEKG